MNTQRKADAEQREKGGKSAWTAGVIGIITTAAIVWAISDVASLPEPGPKVAIDSAATATSAAAESKAPSQPSPVAAAPAMPQAGEPATPVQVSMPAAPRRDGPVTPVYIATNATPNMSAPEMAVARDTRAVAARETQIRRVQERAARPAKATAVVDQRTVTDAQIRSRVLGRLAANRATIYGRIGVESRDSVVRLTGYTQTAGQAERAEREARKVRGVRAVRNEIRPRIGGSR